MEHEYYSKTTHRHSSTKSLLGKAKKNLEQLVKKHGNAWSTHGSMLCRMKILLGDPIHEVEASLKMACDEACIPQSIMAAYQNSGLFYEILGPRCHGALKKALFCHNKAIKVYHKVKKEQPHIHLAGPHIAWHGKLAIESGAYSGRRKLK